MAGRGVIATGMVLLLLAGCSPPSGIAPPTLLTADEIAALQTPGAPASDGLTIDNLEAGLPASETADSADPRLRGDALRARAAELRARQAAQETDSDVLRRRAAALRQAATAPPAPEQAEDLTDDEKEHRLSD